MNLSIKCLENKYKEALLEYFRCFLTLSQLVICGIILTDVGNKPWRSMFDTVIFVLLTTFFGKISPPIKKFSYILIPLIIVIDSASTRHSICKPNWCIRNQGEDEADFWDAENSAYD